MSEQPKTTICVNYKCVDGWHVFASDDLPGLYVASQDAKTAFDDVATAIEKLLHLNQGVKVKAEPELSFMDFVRSVSKTAKQKREMREQQPLVMSAKRFVLYAT
jgi:hypothetical protein